MFAGLMQRSLLRASAAAVVSAEVSPTTFFGASERGVVIDLTNLSNLFQNIDGTVAVTTAGDPVGYVADLSGNANHLTAAANNTTRPTYQVDGDGKPYLSFDGSNDVVFGATPFVTPGGALSHTYTGSVGLYGAAQSATKTLISNNSTSDTIPFVVPLQASGTTTTLLQAARNNASGVGTTYPSLTSVLDSTKRVITSASRNSDGRMRMRDAASRPAGGGDGSYTTTTNTGLGTAISVTRMGVGANSGATPANYFNGRIYSFFLINRDLTDTEVKNGENWSAARCLTAALP